MGNADEALLRIRDALSETTVEDEPAQIVRLGEYRARRRTRPSAAPFLDRLLAGRTRSRSSSPAGTCTAATGALTKVGCAPPGAHRHALSSARPRFAGFLYWFAEWLTSLWAGYRSRDKL